MKSVKTVITISLLISLLIALMYFIGIPLARQVYANTHQRHTVDSVMALYGDKTRVELKKAFRHANMPYPPQKITLLAIKDEKKLTLWSSNAQGQYQYIRSYPILAASGKLGPKLQEGDRQVPEGIYRIIGLNPNSSYHLSMKLNYPNTFDLKYAKAEGRTQPGSNIFIHGKAASIGCLAMGDPAIEQLFTLVHDVGRENVEVIISPTNPNLSTLKQPKNTPKWVNTLYQNIQNASAKLQQK